MLKVNRKKNKIRHEILSQILILALLSASQIEEGVQFVEKIVEEKCVDHGILKKWKKFLKLDVRKHWLLDVQPRGFSVFKSPIRTKDYFQDYHISLNKIDARKSGNSFFMSKYLK